MLPQGLESLPQRGVGHVERQAELGLLESLDQQEQGRPQGGRQDRKRGAFDAVVSGVGFVARGGADSDAHLAGPAASGAAGEEGAVAPRRTVSAVEERLAVEVEPTPQGGQDDVVSEVLSFVGRVAVLQCGFDQGLADRFQRRHRDEMYHQ